MHSDTIVFRRKSEVSMNFGLQISTACAFKWDLKAKVDESNGILLPIHGIRLFCKQNEHPRVDFGSAETKFWSPVEAHKDAQWYISFPKEK